MHTRVKLQTTRIQTKCLHIVQAAKCAAAVVAAAASLLIVPAPDAAADTSC